jgi:hypothetical protein
LSLIPIPLCNSIIFADLLTAKAEMTILPFSPLLNSRECQG